MLVAALLGFDRIPENARNLALYAAAVEIGNRYAFGREDRHIAIRQEEHVLRMRQDSGDVAGNEVLILADADHDRRAEARGDNLVRIGTRDDRKGKDPGEFFDSSAHRFLLARK